jgi:hypothetical protein
MADHYNGKHVVFICHVSPVFHTFVMALHLDKQASYLYDCLLMSRALLKHELFLPHQKRPPFTAFETHTSNSMKLPYLSKGRHRLHESHVGQAFMHDEFSDIFPI